MGLQQKCLHIWGFPRYCSRSWKFVNEIVKETLTLWPGQVVVINGRPRHSQSQGLVEKGNHFVEMQIQTMIKEWGGTGNVPWTDWLPRIQCMLLMVVRQIHFLTHADNLNTQLCCTLKKSLYKVVYGQPPRTTQFAELPNGTGSCIMEEEVADLMNGKHI